MKLKAVVLEGFRGYKDRTRVNLSNLTTIVGRNDSGKSTILEALEIFFNSDQIKIEKSDLCVHLDDGETTARIGCIFEDFDHDVVIDATAPTTLGEEFLLNRYDELEIHKTFDLSKPRITPVVIAVANHPQEESLSQLLQMKQTELRKYISDNGIPADDIDQRSNVAMRRRIREHLGVGTLAETDIALESAEDTKKIWARLVEQLPLYALFRADRPSRDADSEVTNPLNLAVAEAIRTVKDDLERIDAEVRQHATEVTTRTLEKLQEMDPRLASELKPDFKSDRKWEKLFSFELNSDHNIPINKRGSGVRRLILISFFRAEAERRRTEKSKEGIIYAIEEPETSQNPLNQRLLAEAFIELADQDGIQVLVTTHTPGLAGAMPEDGLVHVSQNEARIARVRQSEEGLQTLVAYELGVTADKRLELILFVEGPTDVDYFCRFSELLHQRDSSIPNIKDDPRIAVIPVGGSNLKQWVERHYLEQVKVPELHIYDRGAGTPPKFQAECNKVNARSDLSQGVLTNRYEIENYLHPDAVKEGLGLECGTIKPDEDFVLRIAHIANDASAEAKPWNELDSQEKKGRETRMKKRLAREVLPLMTYDQLRSVDHEGEVLGWLEKARSKLALIGSE